MDKEIEKLKQIKGERFLEKLKDFESPDENSSSSEDSDEDKFDWYKTEDPNYFTITATS